MRLAGPKIEAAKIGAIAQLSGNLLDQLDCLAVDLRPLLQRAADRCDRKTESGRNRSQRDALADIPPQLAPNQRSLRLGHVRSLPLCLPGDNAPREFHTQA